MESKNDNTLKNVASKDKENTQSVTEINGKSSNITPEQSEKLIRDIVKSRRKLLDKLSKT